MKTKIFNLVVLIIIIFCIRVNAQLKPDTLRYKPFVWKSETPADCPFEKSKELTGIGFIGLKSGFHFGDTWYPTWADDGNLYSPWTDGKCWRLDETWEHSASWDVEHATTGQGVIIGDNPLTLKAYSLGLCGASSLPYHGRYPCGSLIYNKQYD